MTNLCEAKVETFYLFTLVVLNAYYILSTLPNFITTRVFLMSAHNNKHCRTPLKLKCSIKKN
jgi:hypothetical protein